MSLFKIAVGLAVAVAFMPTDERRQAEFAASAGAAVNNALTYCDRNPEPCTKVAEGWAQFKRKAEFGLSLASRMVRDAVEKRAAVATEELQLPPTAEPTRDYPRIEPRHFGTRGTLSPTDVTSEWRPPVRRTSY